ncbi:MAG: protein translocase subunit SecF [Nitrospirota bacterium]
MFEIIKTPKIDFIGKRNIAFMASGIFIAIGIVALIQIARGAINLGIDFSGGTSVHLKFEKPIPMDHARKILEQSGLKDVDLQDFPAENKLLIRIKKSDIETGKVSENIVRIFSEGFSGTKFVVDSTTEIGPKIGKSLQKDALIAVAIATAGILIYIAWRFRFKFGVAATIATFHDVLFVLGVFYIMNKEINLLLITALLTIAGYSLTDTVVVFDRIRENMKLRYKEPIPLVINSSINEVLSRTIITAGTTFLAATALFFFGGEVIHDFAFAILIGIAIGTYSSIFIASPILVVWKGRLRK